MKHVKAMIKDINDSLHKLDLSIMVLKTLVLLVVSYTILFIFGLPGMLSVIPALVYFLSSLAVAGRFDNLKRVEKKYEDLDEKLRTARDYKTKDNMVLEALEKEILRDLKKVKLSDFFPFAQTALLVVVLIVAVSTSLFVSNKNVRVLDFNEFIEQAREQLEEQTPEEIEQGQFTGTEESFLQVGEEQVQVEINPVGLDLDFSQVEDDPQYSFSTSFPKDVFLSSEAAYESEFTEEQQVLIKRYFEKKRGG